VLHARPLRPVSRISDQVRARGEIPGQTRRIENGAAVVGERDEARDERIIPDRIALASVVPAGVQAGRVSPPAAQFGANGEDRDAAAMTARLA